MPDESITEKMNHYLTANRAKSAISKMHERYDLYHASQQIGNVLHNRFGYQKPSFVISGITPDSIEKLGFECVETPCLLTLMNHQHVINQFIFGRIQSYRDDTMVADFINLRHLSKAQMKVILTQIHQINHCFLPETHLAIHGKQVVISQRLSKTTFAKTVIHLLEDQFAIQNGPALLDDGEEYHF